ncbi:hypothetical protein [Nocardiopsis halophila]|uniref:hypothetical protein n=1 Tax=Nocardiopsis halophila TaxID=141692 RepID=UPI001377301C|nr:hypothetical protein [Nocardiopsis halophila]
MRTLQEALTRVASGRSGIPLCGATAEDDRRGDIAFVPVSGLADSALALVWPRGKGTAELQDLAPVLTVCDR